MKRGFSLLEVILAMAILTGSIVVLGEVARYSLQNAQYARDLTRAEMICESKLSEVLAGVVPADGVQDSPVDYNDDDRTWVYSIETESVDDSIGLLSVRVTAKLGDQQTGKPVTATLTRWMTDPNYSPPNSSSSQNSSSGSSSSGSGSSGSTSSGSGS